MNKRTKPAEVAKRPPPPTYYCDTCSCPLTLLKVTQWRREVRTRCARCTEARVVQARQKPVYRAPLTDKPRSSKVREVDAFMNSKTQGKSNATDT